MSEPTPHDVIADRLRAPGDTAPPDIALKDIGGGHYLASRNIESGFAFVGVAATPGDTAPLASDSDTAEVPA